MNVNTEPGAMEFTSTQSLPDLYVGNNNLNQSNQSREFNYEKSTEKFKQELRKQTMRHIKCQQGLAIRTFQ